MSGSNIFDPRTTRAGRDNPRFCAGIKQSFSSGVSIMIYDTDTRTLLDGIKGDWWCEYVSGHVPQPTCCSKRSEMGEPEYVSLKHLQDLCPSVVAEILTRVLSYGFVANCHDDNILSNYTSGENKCVAQFQRLLNFKMNMLLNFRGDVGPRKAAPMDVWVLIHPGFKQVLIVDSFL